MPGGREILAFADAVVGSDRAALDRARQNLAGSVGPVAVSAAAAIAATFTKNDRMANGTGIPSELKMLRNSREIRAELGLNVYRSSASTFRHYPDDR